MEQNNRIDPERKDLVLYDFLIHGCVTILSSTLLNVLIGIFGGLAINVFSSDPTSSNFDTSLFLIFIFIVISVVLLFFNENLQYSRSNSNSVRPALSTFFSFQNLAITINKPFNLIRNGYLVFVIGYIGCLYFGLKEFSDVSYRLKQVETKRIESTTQLQDSIASLKKDVVRQENVIYALRDTLDRERSKPANRIVNQIKGKSL